MSLESLSIEYPERTCRKNLMFIKVLYIVLGFVTSSTRIFIYIISSIVMIVN